MKPLKKILITAVALSVYNFSNAQVNVLTNQEKLIPYTKNEIGMEIGGNSLFYSAYYQRALFRKNNVQFNIRIGGGVLPGFDQDYMQEHSLIASAYIMPNILVFKKRHAWEFGVGFNVLANYHTNREYVQSIHAIIESPDNMQDFFITPQIGYRAYLKNSKFYFRAAVSTFILTGYHQSDSRMGDVEPKWLPWGAVGFGYTF